MPPTIPEQYWQLTPVGETFEVDLTMNHYLQPNDQLLLCKIDNPGWDCANDLSSEVTITKLGVTQFNDLGGIFCQIVTSKGDIGCMM